VRAVGDGSSASGGLADSRISLSHPLHDDRTSFYFVKLQALTETKDWPSLEAFAKARKSPIGYEPFVTHLVAKGHPREAAKYVPRCDAKNRVVRQLLRPF
jgi:hypothetical protein